MTVLEEIAAHKRAELDTLRRSVPDHVVAERARFAPPARPFAGALRRPGLSVVAEVKAASPSAGILREHLNPAELARAYAQGGARGLSILTDRRFFRGSPEHLQAAREAVALPVLRKDFTLDAYHVYEARALGADAVLLLASLLSERQLSSLRALVEALGMEALVEVHTEGELDRALGSGARLVGINNRDLRTFRVDLTTTERLRPRIPDGVLVLSESGIETPEDVRRLWDAGVQAVLVGTALVRSPDPAGKLQELIAAVEGGRAWNG